MLRDDQYLEYLTPLRAALAAIGITTTDLKPMTDKEIDEVEQLHENRDWLRYEPKIDFLQVRYSGWLFDYRLEPGEEIGVDWYPDHGKWTDDAIDEFHASRAPELPPDATPTAIAEYLVSHIAHVRIMRALGVKPALPYVEPEPTFKEFVATCNQKYQHIRDVIGRKEQPAKTEGEIAQDRNP